MFWELVENISVQRWDAEWCLPEQKVTEENMEAKRPVNTSGKCKRVHECLIRGCAHHTPDPLFALHADGEQCVFLDEHGWKLVSVNSRWRLDRAKWIADEQLQNRVQRILVGTGDIFVGSASKSVSTFKATDMGLESCHAGSRSMCQRSCVRQLQILGGGLPETREGDTKLQTCGSPL